MVADRLDLLGLALAALLPKGRGTLLAAQGHDPDAAGPRFQLPHQLLAELLRRLLERIELEMAGAEANKADLLGQSILELQVALLAGERHQILEAFGIGERRLGIGCRSFARRCFDRGRLLGRGVGRLARRLPGGGRTAFAILAAGTTAVPKPGEIARGRQIGGVGKAHENHVGGGMGPRRASHLVMTFEQHLPGAGEHRHRQAAAEVGGARTLRLARGGVGGVGRLGERHRVHGVGEIGDHLCRLGAVAGERGELPDRGTGVAGKHGLEQIEDAAAIGKAEETAHVIARDLAGAEGDGAIEDGERVPDRAFGRARDQHQGGGIGVGTFLGGDRAEMGRERLDLDALQIETLAARQHRDRNLAHLGGGEDELHMLRRLFQRLEQAVEGLLRQHVDLVDDVDLVAGGVRLVVGAVDQVADVVDAGMGGCVHLDHIEMAALEDGAAMDPLLAHVEGRAAGAARRHVVQGAGDQAGGGGLADAAHPGEHVGLGDAPGGKGVPQRLHHGVLADQLGEQLRPVFAGERGVARRRRQACLFSFFGHG